MLTITLKTSYRIILTTTKIVVTTLLVPFPSVIQ